MDEAESYFFKVLCFKPFDPSSLNGLGSVLLLERELDAAEFFIRRAIELAGGHYPEAEARLETSPLLQGPARRPKVMPKGRTQFEAYRSLGEHTDNILFLRALVGDELSIQTP